MIHSFLLIGQSNMAGRGNPKDVPPMENNNVKMLVNGRWQNLIFPINRDRAFSGVSLAESFADAYSKERNVTVGLIPCADGGTSLDQWCEGGLLYDNAVYQAKLASRTSTIAGVLWHQGEQDCTVDRYMKYREKFTKIVNALRRDLDLYDVPFLLGGLGEFLKYSTIGEQHKEFNMNYYVDINNALKEMAENDEMMGYVSSENLTSLNDYLHFDAVSLREFGLRYYEVFKTIEKKDKVFLEKPEDDVAIRSFMEQL